LTVSVEVPVMQKWSL